MLDGRWRATVEHGLEPVGRGLHKAGITADGLTVIGLVFACSGVGSLVGAVSAGIAVRRLRVGPTLMLGKSLWIVGSLLVAFASLLGQELAFVVIGKC